MGKQPGKGNNNLNQNTGLNSLLGNGPVTGNNNKPKKVYNKPQTSTDKAVQSLNSNKTSNEIDYTALARELGYNAIPHTNPTSVLLYKVGGIAAALNYERNSVMQDKGLSRTESKKTNPTFNSTYAKNAVNEYQLNHAVYNKYKDFKGDDGDGWIKKGFKGAMAYVAGANILVDTGVKNAIDYAGIGIGHAFDFADWGQKVRLPNVYDLNDIKTSVQEGLNEFNTFDQKLTKRLFNIGASEDKINKAYENNKKNIIAEKARNKAKAEEAIQKGTYNSDSEKYWNSTFVGGAVNHATKTLSGAAKFLDTYVFRDSDNEENWFSNFSQKQLDEDTNIRLEAQHRIDKENGRTTPRNQGFLKETWDEDNRDFFTKVFEGDHFESFDDILDVDNRIMPLVGQAVGTIIASQASLAGFGKIFGGLGKLGSKVTSSKALGNVATKVPAINKFTEYTSKFMQKPSVLKAADFLKGKVKGGAFAFTMSYDESQQIGHQVFEKAIEEKLVEATGIDKNTFYSQYKPADGNNFSPAEMANMDKDYEETIIKKFQEANPEQFKKILKEANAASDLATTINLLPATVTNFLMFGKYKDIKGVTSSARRALPFLEKPIFKHPVTKLSANVLKSVGGEGVLEEAGINLIAQRKGEFYSEGKYYDIDSYKKELGSKEWTENFIGGALMGGPQSAIMHVTNGQYNKDAQEYRAYKQVIDDYKKLGEYTGENELGKYLALNLDYKNAKELARKETEYESKLEDLNDQLKSVKNKQERKEVQTKIDSLNDSFSHESNKFITTKISNAIQTGTTHKLIQSLEQMSEVEGINPEDKSDLLDTIDSIKKLENVYNKHYDLKDSSNIITNRFSNIVNSKELIKLNAQISELELKKTEALSRQARLRATEESRMYKAKPVEGQPDVAQWKDTTKAFKQRYESHLENLKEEFNQGNDLGEADLRKLNELKDSRNNFQVYLDRNEIEYQKLTSKEYQDKIEPRRLLFSQLNTLYSKNLSPEILEKQKADLLNLAKKDLDQSDITEITEAVEALNLYKEQVNKQLEEEEKRAKLEEESEKLKIKLQQEKEAKNKLEEAKKTNEVLSQEKKDTLEEKVSNTNLGEGVMSPEERSALEERKVELAVKEEITPEEATELAEINSKTQANERLNQLDTLLTPEENDESDDSDVDEILSMFGVDRSAIDETKMGRAENNLSIGEDDNYTPGIINEGEAYQDPIKNYVGDIIGDIAFRDNKNTQDVNAEEVLNELVRIAGKDKAEKAFNIIKTGYSLNHPDKSVDFDRLYDKYFSNRLATLDNLMDRFLVEEDTNLEKEVTPEVPATQIAKPKFDANNNPIVEVTNVEEIQKLVDEDTTQRTENPNIKKSNIELSTETLTNILPGILDSNYRFIAKNHKGLKLGNLFDFSKYEREGSDKLPFRVTLAEDYQNVLVKDERNRFNSIPFSEWEQLYGFPKGSPEWLAKVPMVASINGEATFNLNESTYPYTKDLWELDPSDTPQDIANKKAYFEYMNNVIRQEVYNNGSSNILVKTNMKVDVIRETDSIPLTEMSSEVLVGVYDGMNNTFKVNGQVIPTINNNLTYFNNQGTVILKPVGVNPDGSRQYQAFQVDLSVGLSKTHKASLIGAVLTYLSRNIPAALNSNVTSFKDSLRDEGNIDLTNSIDLSRYIDSIYKVSYFESYISNSEPNEGETKTKFLQRAFSEFVNNPVNKARPGQPMIAIVNHKVMLAIKPQGTNSIKPEDIFIVDPLNIKSEQDFAEQTRDLVTTLNRALSKNKTLNITTKIRGNDKYFLLGQNGETLAYDSYEEYSRGVIQVPGNARNGKITNPDGTTQDIPFKYATLELSKPEGFGMTYEEFVESRNAPIIEQNKIEEVRKILEEETPNVEVSNEAVQELKDKLEKAERSRAKLVSLNLSTETVDGFISSLRNDLQDLGEDINQDNYSVTIMSETQVQDMLSRERSTVRTIEGLSLYEQSDITSNVFNVIARSIGYKKGSKINKNKILSDIRNKVFGIVDKTLLDNNSTVETLQELAEFEPKLQTDINNILEKNKVLEAVKTNWSIIEEDVLDLLSTKTGIKEVKDKSNPYLEDNDDGLDDKDPSVVAEDSLDETPDTDVTENTKDFGSSSLEEKGKATVSYKMKRFLAGIPITSKEGVIEKGFLDLERYYDFRDLDNLIKVAINSPVEIDSDFNTVINKLKSIQNENPWVKPLLDRLTSKDTPEQTRIEFMYNYTGRHAISSKLVEFEESRGMFKTRILDANFSDISRNIRNTWKNNVKVDGNIYQDNGSGEYVANLNKVKELHKKFLDLSSTLNSRDLKEYVLARNYVPTVHMNVIAALNPGETYVLKKEDHSNYANFLKQVKSVPARIDFKLGLKVELDLDGQGNLIFTKPAISTDLVNNLSNWLQEVGLNLSEKTFTDLVNNGLLSVDGKTRLSIGDLINPQNLNSPFSAIARNLDVMSKGGTNLNFNSFTVLDKMNDQLLALANVESKYTNQVITKNFRDNGKLMQGLPVGKYATDRMKELLSEDSDTRKKLSQMSFNGQSMLLSLLNSDPSFREKFKMYHMANGSIKQKDSSFQGEAKVSDLTAMDLEFTKLSHFFEMENMSNYNMTFMKDFLGIGETRMGGVFLPTMSDKDQMMGLQTLVFSVNDFNYKDGQFSDKLLELAYTQLVKPDLERISSFHSRNRVTDIKEFENAAQLFTLVSSMNTLRAENGETITSLMRANPSLYNSEYVEKTYKELFKKELNEYLNYEVSNKVDKWNKLNIIDAKGKIKLNSSYLETRKETSTPARNRNIAAEFVLNNLLTNANVHMLFIGDPALYSKDKVFNKNNFETEKTASGKVVVNPTKPLNESVYRNWSESLLGTNLGKRLALMLAPGNKIHNSKNETYHQIYLKDFVDISTNIVDLIDDFYGNDARVDAEESVALIKSFNNRLSQEDLSQEDIDNLQGARSTVLKDLSNKYGDLADYLDIEATDAQEYTTSSEHIDILRRQGKIDDESYENITKKLAEQAKGLSTSNYLTKKELGLVLQPIKPVHTGQIFDTDNDVARTVYVKSSSFPLLPQLTYGTELDGLRNVLEQYEKTNGGYKVRASYDTANKVGALKNPLTVFNLDGTFNTKGFTLEAVANSKLELNRNNFRIQQDVPYKSDKGKEDLVSYGTQMLKVLFSNGILDVNGGFLNPEWREDSEDIPKHISGRELFQQFNQNFVDLVNIKKEQLYLELGLNKNGSPVNEVTFKENVAKLLEKEGKKRDYSRNDLESLKLDSEGNFTLPLFLNQQSGKIESLLLSIISTRAIKHKFPGYSYVAASEAGFKLKKLDNADAVPGRNRIIYTNKFNGELQGMLHEGSENIKFAQVMVPSKFRNNVGELVDMYAKNKEGEYMYINIDEEGRFKLKDDMIQEQLLNMTSFRIPTSSHVSLSQIEVVGILPPEAGDIIVVPKNFTKQKGLDFDVDKENAYHLWTYINQNGQLKELSTGRVNYMLEKLQKSTEKQLENLLDEDNTFAKELMSTLGSEDNYKEFVNDKARSLADKARDLKNLLEQKLLENKIIKVHSAVLSNSDKAVRQKINKVLSMDFSKEQATNITNLKEIGKKNKFIKDNTTNETTPSQLEQDYYKNNKYFSILSEDYQSYKMFLGSAGKSGIGVYSNFLTMASLFQQYGPQGTFKLQQKVMDPFDPSKTIMETLRFKVGGLQVSGILGKLRTIDGDRTISEVFEELQNTATDNEKEQIMGRTGINNHTIGAFSIMSILGLDKTDVSSSILAKYNLKASGNKMSFGNLLLSQDIVSELVGRLEFANSNLTEYDSKQVLDIIKEMKEEVGKTLTSKPDNTGILFDDNGDFISLEEELDFPQLTGDNLVQALAGDLNDMSNFNFDVLSMLELVMGYQATIRSAQKVLNISSKGLGLDLAESNNSNQILENVIENNYLPNIEKLLFRRIDDDSEISDKDKNNLVYINGIGKVLPISPIGASVLNGFDMSRQLWGRYFPYTNKAYNSAVGLALNSTTINPNGTSQAKVNFERKFAKEFKKYLNSRTVLFNGTVKAERERLFFDTETNTSLASYLQDLLQSDIKDVVARNLIHNPLIKKLTFDRNTNSKKNTKNRQISRILYNDSNSVVENTDVLYRALPELIELNAVLLPYNNQPYTTRLLAQDLINYAFLEGGIQEIQQFVKYVPISYLQSMGFTGDILDKYNNYPNFLSIKDPSDATKTITPSFVRQYFQHNPDSAKRITSINGVPYEELKRSKTFDATVNTEFTLNQEESKQFGDFVSILDRTIKARNKSVLFERDPSNPRRYVKRDVAGYNGLSEYDSSKRLIKTLRQVEVTDTKNPPIQTVVEGPRVVNNLGIGTQTTRQVIDNMLELDNEFTKVFEPFRNYVPNNLEIVIEDTKGNARYSGKDNKIFIHPKVLDMGVTQLSKMLVKELVHAATRNHVDKYLDFSGNYITPTQEQNVPLPVRKLKVLYQDLLRVGGTRTNSKGVTLNDFLKDYKRGSGVTQENFDKFYGFTDIHEFMEMAMTEPTFRSFLDEISTEEEKKTGISFLQRLKDVFRNLFSNLTSNQVSKEVVNTVTELIFDKGPSTNVQDTTDSNYSPEIEDVFSRAESLLNSLNSVNFADNNILNEMEDPFKC